MEQLHPLGSEREREAERLKEKVRVNVCAVTKMDLRVSHWHAVGFHPGCSSDQFGHCPEISTLLLHQTFWFGTALIIFTV